MLRCFGRASGLLLGLAVLAASPSGAGSGIERFDRHGISFQYPSEWFVTTRPLSNGTNPHYRFAVSTVPVRRTRRDVGPCLPGIAAQLRSDSVLAYLREATGADRTRSLPRMSTRPRRFRLPTRVDYSLCGFGRRADWIPFKQAGRAFYLGIYIAPRATSATERALKRLLDGMRIRPV